MANITLDQSNKIDNLIDNANGLEWGTEDQINAENSVYDLTSELFGIDWNDHSDYLLKATTPEAMEYVSNTINKLIDA